MGLSADAQARTRCFFDCTDPPEEQQLCPELRSLLAAMRRVEPVAPLVMGQANPKSPEFVCVLDAIPSPQAVKAARFACADMPQVDIGRDWIVCTTHWSELAWGDPPEASLPAASTNCRPVENDAND